MALRRPVPLTFLACLLATLCACSAPGPAQSPNVAVSPDVDQTASIKRLEAAVANVQQQALQLTQTITTLVQENGSLRASVREVQGNLSQVTSNYALDPQRRQQDQGTLIVYALMGVITCVICVFIPPPSELWARVVLVVMGIGVPVAALIVMGLRSYRTGV